MGKIWKGVRCLEIHHSLREIKHWKYNRTQKNWLRLFGTRAIKQQRKPLTQNHFACDSKQNINEVWVCCCWFPPPPQSIKTKHRGLYPTRLNFLKTEIKAGCQRQVLTSWNYRLLMVTFPQPQLRWRWDRSMLQPQAIWTYPRIWYPQLNRHFESVTQFSYHDIMPLHLGLLTGQFLTFQLQAVQDIVKSKYNADLDLHSSKVNTHPLL